MSVQKENLVKSHFALYDTKLHRSRCKMPGCTHFSHLFCEECKVHLCITSKRNCFYEYHHNSQPEENNTARQNKPMKGSRQTIKAANVKKDRSGRRRTSDVVNNQKMCSSAKKKNSSQHVFEYKTRNQENKCAKTARELAVTESSESQKEIFMTKIGLATKKNATR